MTTGVIFYDPIQGKFVSQSFTQKCDTPIPPFMGIVPQVIVSFTGIDFRWSVFNITEFNLLGILSGLSGLIPNILQKCCDFLNHPRAHHGMKRPIILIEIFSKRCDQFKPRLDQAQNDLNGLIQNPPESLEDWSTYEAKKQTLLTELIDLAKIMQRSTFKLTDATAKKKLDHLEEKIDFSYTTYRQFQDLHNSLVPFCDYLNNIFTNVPNQLAESQLNADYANRMIEYSSCQQKFGELSACIWDPNTSEEQRDIAHLELVTLKTELDQRLIQLSQLSNTATLHIDIDFSLQQNFIQAKSDDTQFYFQTDKENLAMLQELLKKGDSHEYLSQSILYQHKLKSKGMFDSAAKYAIDCMRSLPDTAPPTDVLKMGYLFLEAVKDLATPKKSSTVLNADASTSPNSDANPADSPCPALSTEALQNIQTAIHDFKCLFIQWYCAHPEFHIILDEMGPLKNPEDLNNREAVTLLAGKLCASDQDQSLEAKEIYQECERFLLTDSTFPFMEAICDITLHKYSDAKAILKDLTPEQAIIVMRGMALSQYETWSTLANEVGFIISIAREHLFPTKGRLGRTANALNAGIQFAADPIVQRLWVPTLIDYSEQLQANLPQISIGSIAYLGFSSVQNFNLLGLGLDYWYSNDPENREWGRYYLQGGLSLGLNIARAAKPWLSPISNNPTSLYTFAKISHAALPLQMIGASLVEPYLSTNGRAILQTTMKTLCAIAGVDDILSIRNFRVTQSLRIFLNSKAKFRMAFTAAAKIGQFIKKAIPRLTTANATATFFTTKAIVYDYPRIKGACAIEDANQLCAQGKFPEAKKVLDTAKKSIVGNGPFQEYGQCIEFLEELPRIQATAEWRLKLIDYVLNVDAALTKFKADSRYESIYNNLLLFKIIAQLKVNDFASVKKSLDGDIDTSVKEQVLGFMLNHAKTLSLQTAEDYLRTAEAIFKDAAYKTIITKFKEYTTHQKEHPVFRAASAASERLTAIDSLSRLVAPMRNLYDFYSALQFDRLCVYVDTCQNAGAANALLQKMAQPNHTKLALYLINQAEVLCAEGKYDKAIEYLRGSRDSLHPIHYTGFNQLIDQYLDYIASRKNTPDLMEGDLEDNLRTRINAISALIHQTGLIDEFSSLCAKLQFEKLRILVDAKIHTLVNKYLQNMDLIVHNQLTDYIFHRANTILHERGCTEACEFLQNAHDTLDVSKFDGFKDLMIQYRTYITQQQAIPNTPKPDQLGKRLASIDAVTKHIERFSEFSTIQSDLQFEKICLFVDEEKYQDANEILKKTEAPIHTKLALYLVSQAEALSSGGKYDEAISYLQRDRKPLESFEYSDFAKLFEHYQRHITAQKAAPEMTKETDISERIAAIDAVISFIKPIPEFSQLTTKLQFEKICTYVETENYTEANALLQNMEPAIHRKLSFHLLSRVAYLCGAGKYDLAHENLRKAGSLCLSKFAEQKDLVAKYQEYITIREKAPDNLEGLLGKTNSISQSIEKITEFSPLYWELQRDKLLIQVDIGKHPEANALLAKLDFPIHTNLAFYLIQRAEAAVLKNRREDAYLYLSKAGDMTQFIHSVFIAKYKEYMICRESERVMKTARSKTLIQVRIDLIDAVVSHIERIDSTIPIYSKLQFEKLCVLIDSENYQTVNDLLPGMEPAIHNKLAAYILHRTETLCRNNENGLERACQFLEEIAGYIQTDFDHSNLLKKYKAYISNRQNSVSTNTDINKRITEINDLISDAQKIDDSALLYALQSDGFMISMDAERYEEAKSYWNPEIAKKIPPQFFTTQVAKLIHKGERLIQQEGISATNRFFSRIPSEIGIRENNLVQEYLIFLTNFERTCDQDPSIQTLTISIESIDKIINGFHEANLPIPHSFNQHKMGLYIGLGEFYERNAKYIEDCEKASNACELALKLFPENKNDKEELLATRIMNLKFRVMQKMEECLL